MSRYFIVALFSLTILFSCNKASTTTDPRNQFVGTWKGTENFTISSLLDSSFSTTKVITKSTTDSSQIIIVDSADVAAPQTATVNGNSYTYKNFTETTTMQGKIVTINLGGSGIINGNKLTESGTISTVVPGTSLSLGGTWSSSLSK